MHSCHPRSRPHCGSALVRAVRECYVQIALACFGLVMQRISRSLRVTYPDSRRSLQSFSTSNAQCFPCLERMEEETLTFHLLGLYPLLPSSTANEKARQLCDAISELQSCTQELRTSVRVKTGRGRLPLKIVQGSCEASSFRLGSRALFDGTCGSLKVVRSSV